MQNTAIDKNSREYLMKNIASSRINLLMVIVFTVVNIILLLTEADTYFLFSASVPYYLTLFGLIFDMGEGFALVIGTYTITALVISAVILAMYLVCWLLSKKNKVWFIVATVLFAVDTLALVVLSLDELSASIIDLVFHGWVMVSLIQAVISSKKLAALPVQEVPGQVVQEQPVAPAQEVEPWNRTDIE